MPQVQSSNEFFGCDSLTSNPLLLFSEQLIADPIVVVSSQQLPFLLLELDQAALRRPDLAFADLFEALEVISYGIADCLALLGGQLNRHVVTLHRCFDRFHAMVGLRTLVSLPGDADEVLVGPAPAVGSRVHQAPTAFGAEDAASEVVVVAPGGSAALSLRREDHLHLFVLLLTDKRLMPPGVGFSAISHDAEVVRVPQKL